MIEQIRQAANAQNLDILDALHEGEDTVLLLGPHELGFWAVFKSSPEAQDGGADPLDRWSKRIIHKLATQVFPLGWPALSAFHIMGDQKR